VGLLPVPGASVGRPESRHHPNELEEAGPLVRGRDPFVRHGAGVAASASGSVLRTGSIAKVASTK
jgi:hypothetical protein